MNPEISFDTQSRESVNYGLQLMLQEELQKLRARVATNIVKAGQNTTGKTIASMKTRVEATSDGFLGTLTARPYFGALETGSRPWRTQYYKTKKDGSRYLAAPKFFIDIMRDWMNAKNVPGSPFLVATKIMSEGSKLFREGGREDIYTNEIPQTISNIQERFTGVFNFIVIQKLSFK